MHAPQSPGAASRVVTSDESVDASLASSVPLSTGSMDVSTTAASLVLASAPPASPVAVLRHWAIPPTRAHAYPVGQPTPLPQSLEWHWLSAPQVARGPQSDGVVQVPALFVG